MKNTMKFMTLSLLAVTISITSCTKEGPAGPMGTTGSVGTAGNNGTNGADGNANVKTATFDLVSEDWLADSNYIYSTSTFSSSAKGARMAEIEIPEISADIHENGLVLAYFKPLSDQGWEPLPFSFFSRYTGLAYTTHIHSRSEIGKVNLYYFWERASSTDNIPFNLSTHLIPDYTIKFIIIEGNPINTSGKSFNSQNEALKSLMEAGVDTDDYKAVIDYFDLEY